MEAKAKKIVNAVAFVWQFALDDFKRKYAGSALGSLWAFLQPIVTIVLYWFVFQLGFKSRPVKAFPFILWLIAGLVPWFFISEAIMNSTASLLDYSYLVKKVVFDINILPLAKILSTLLVQLVLIGFMCICFCIGGYWPTIFKWWFFYYICASSLQDFLISLPLYMFFSRTLYRSYLY